MEGCGPPKIIINNNEFIFLTAISILLISNQNTFRVLFDKLAYMNFIRKIYLYFSIVNDLPREPALCQLYRHTFVPCVCNDWYCFNMSMRLETTQ